MSITKEQLRKIREATPYFPKTKTSTLENEKEKYTLLSTLLRVERQGKWYAVLCLAYAPPSKDKGGLFVSLLQNVH